jgi:nucleotidyltransferase-like protein/uncharacterized protein DUF4037
VLNLQLPNVSDDKLRLLGAITEALQKVPSVVAVVLGGSYACGLARPDSDLDIGIYYREASPFSVEYIRSIAESISAAGSSPTVTEMYGWGPWVNGGAWIQTSVCEVDFVYRNLDQVQKVIEEGRQGIWRHDYAQQPTYGFRSIIYFGETFICIPLHDPEDEIDGLKKSIVEYPEILRTRILQDSLWGAEFSMWYCRRFFEKSADVYNAAGCMTRAAQDLVQALFALNREYFVSDKYAGRRIDQFAICPRDFVSRMARVLSNPGLDSAGLRKSTELLSTLWAETVELTAGTYKPRFDL